MFKNIMKMLLLDFSFLKNKKYFLLINGYNLSKRQPIIQTVCDPFPSFKGQTCTHGMTESYKCGSMAHLIRGIEVVKAMILYFACGSVYIDLFGHPLAPTTLFYGHANMDFVCSNELSSFF